MASRPPAMPCARATVTAGALPSISRRANDHELFQTIHDPLRQVTRTRHTLSAGSAGLGRPHRLRPSAGQELAADGLRFAGPLGWPFGRARFAIAEWFGRAL